MTDKHSQYNPPVSWFCPIFSPGIGGEPLFFSWSNNECVHRDLLIWGERCEGQPPAAKRLSCLQGQPLSHCSNPTCRWSPCDRDRHPRINHTHQQDHASELLGHTGLCFQQFETADYIHLVFFFRFLNFPNLVIEPWLMCLFFSPTEQTRYRRAGQPQDNWWHRAGEGRGGASGAATAQNGEREAAVEPGEGCGCGAGAGTQVGGLMRRRRRVVFSKVAADFLLPVL